MSRNTRRPVGTPLTVIRIVREGKKLMLEVNNFYMLQFTDDTEKLKKLFVLFRNRSFEALALKLFRPKIEHN